MITKSNFPFLVLIFFNFGSVIAQNPNSETPLPITTNAERHPTQGKGIFSLQFLAGGGFDDIKTGVIAVKNNNSNDTTEITLAPGGGLGLEFFGGQQLSKTFRLGLYAGFQYTPETPAIDEGTIRFRKFYVAPMLHTYIRFNEKHSISLGLGAMINFANNLLIKPPSSVNQPSAEISYKNNVGFTSQLHYEYQISDKSAFFGGLRLHWADLKVEEVFLGGNKAYLTPTGESQFNNKNGGGANLVFGIQFFF